MKKLNKKNMKLNKISPFGIFVKIKPFAYLILAFFPLITFANDIGDIIFQLPNVLNSVVFLIIGLAILAFLWGIVKYMLSGDDQKQREESKQFMLWGIVGLAVMVSVWGLVSLLGGMFGLQIRGTPSLPNREGGYYF